MKFAVNKQKGSTVNHPTLGEFRGGVAREVTDDEAVMLKNIINIIIFDEVMRRD